jgi:hypothetical protein
MEKLQKLYLSDLLNAPLPKKNLLQINKIGNICNVTGRVGITIVAMETAQFPLYCC